MEFLLNEQKHYSSQGVSYRSYLWYVFDCMFKIHDEIITGSQNIRLSSTIQMNKHGINVREGYFMQAHIGIYIIYVHMYVTTCIKRYLSPAFQYLFSLWGLCMISLHQAPVPLSIFRSNSKFDENSKHSSVKYTRSITTVFCTRHDSVTVQNIVVIGWIYMKLERSEFSSNFEFDQNVLSVTGARYWELLQYRMSVSNAS